ncbi:MAG: glycoside hydrolase family 25 protein [Actinomycetota bacterium]|nr:glycoside hydrolase family 25 protein [Actinomycetota bacterium]
MSTENPLWGVDVSSHQGNVNWAAVAHEGFSWMVSKATEGTYYTNPFYQDSVLNASKVGLVRGAFHFLTNGDPKRQLENFLSVTGDDLEGKLVMVDVEALSYSGVDYSPSFTHVEDFVTGLHERIGEHPILLYSGAWYWHGYLGNPSLSDLVDNYQVKVWDSHYVSGANYASVLYQSVPKVWWTKNCWGGQKPSILQFTSSALVAGQHMDADAFPGTREELEALTKGG